MQNVRFFFLGFPAGHFTSYKWSLQGLQSTFTPFFHLCHFHRRLEEHERRTQINGPSDEYLHATRTLLMPKNHLLKINLHKKLFFIFSFFFWSRRVCADVVFVNKSGQSGICIIFQLMNVFLFYIEI